VIADRAEHLVKSICRKSAKRKQSTFERLNSGKLNRKQRKELIRKNEAEDPGLEVIHRNAAGIDVGNESHTVSVPPDRDPQPIRPVPHVATG